MDFDLSKVRFSKADKIKNIQIPKFLTLELVEDIGIHIGDGTMYKCNSKRTSISISHSTHTTEREYLEYVLALKKSLYNLQKVRKVIYGNELRITLNSIAIATFYNSVFNLPIGKKTKTIDIPKIIKNSNKDIIASCVRGIIDTDFSLTTKFRYGKHYPVLEGSFASKNLILSLSKLFSKLGISYNLLLNERKFHKKTNKFHTQHSIAINGYERIKRFLEIVGFSNSSKLKKLEQIRKNEPGRI